MDFFSRERSKKDITNFITSPRITAVDELYLSPGKVCAYRMHRTCALVKNTSKTRLTYFMFASKLMVMLLQTTSG